MPLHIPSRVAWTGVGFGLYWGWVALVFYGSALVGPQAAAAVGGFWSLTTWVHAVALVAALALSGRLGPWLQTRAGAWVAAVGMTVGTACLALGQWLGIEQLPVLGAVVAGTCSIAQMLGWGSAFVRVSPRFAVPASAVAFAVGLAVYFAVMLVPLSAARSVLAVLMPGVSSALLVRVGPGRDDASAPADAAAPVPGTPTDAPALLSAGPLASAARSWLDNLALLAALLVFAFCGELLRTFSTELSGASVDTMGSLYLGGGLVGLLFLAATCAPRGAVPDERAVGMPLVRNVLVAMAVAFLCIPFLGGWSYAACYALYGAGFWCLRSLVWFYGTSYVRSLGVSFVRVFALLDLPFTLAVVVSTGVESLLLRTVAVDPSQVLVVALVAVFALMSLALLVPSNRRAAAVFGGVLPKAKEPSVAGGVPVEKPAPPVPMPVNAFEGRCGLTAREAEVALLLAQGRSLPFVQETLCISAGTAQTHARHIYKKLDIHSRQELIDLLGSSE